MVWLLLSLGFSLDEFLAGLGRRARESARQPRSSYPGETSYSPGSYNFGGISFQLNSPLIGYVDSSILGSASTSSVLALFSNGIDIGSTFVDENQRLLKVHHKFTQDNDVLFYNVSLQSPLEVFANLRVQSTGKRDNDPPEKHLRVDLKWPVIIAQYQPFSWGTGTADDRYTFPCGDVVNIHFAADLNVLGWADWQFKGLGHVRVDVGVEIEGKVTLGFRAKHANVIKTNCPRFRECRPVVKDFRPFAGFKMAGTLQLCAAGEGQYNGDLGKSEKSVTYLRDWGVNFKWVGTFKTIGHKFGPPRGEFLRTLDETQDSLIKEFAGVSIELSPVIELFGLVSLTLGDKIWNMTVGFSLEPNLTLTGDTGQCVSPGLMRNWLFSVASLLKCDGMEVLERRLLNESNVKTDLIRNEKHGKGCIFISRFLQTDLKKKNSKFPLKKGGVMDMSSPVAKELSWKVDERFAMLKFTNVPAACTKGVGHCWGIFNFDELTPLVPARQLTDNLWAIDLQKAGLKSTTLLIPVHRQSSKEETMPVKLRALFEGPANLVCEQNNELIEVHLENVGCLDPSSLAVNSFARDWVGLGTSPAPNPNPKKKPAPKYTPIPVKDSIIKARTEMIVSALVTIAWFDIKTWNTPGKYLMLARQEWPFAQSALVTVIRGSLAWPFFQRGLPLLVFRSSPGPVDFFVGNVRFHAVQQTSRTFGQFEVSAPGEPEFLRILRLVDDWSNPFVAYTISVNYLTLFTYDNPDGVVQLSGKGRTTFQPGFKCQIVQPGTTAEIYKAWSGTWGQTVLPRVVQLTVILEKGLGTWQLKARIAMPASPGLAARILDIPWGVESYVRDPAAFFSELGIPKADGQEQYTGEQVKLEEDGVIHMKANILFQRTTLKRAEIWKFLDLDVEQVAANPTFLEQGPRGAPVPMPDADPEGEEGVAQGLEADAILLIEVAVGAFVGALIIGLVALMVYRRRSQLKKQSSSGISEERSSDEVRGEGLIERVE